MSYWGSEADGCDFAFGAVGVYVSIIKERMQKDIETVLSKSYPEQSMIASLVCLRMLGERFPKSFSVHFSKRDYEKVKTAFETWYEQVHKKIPRKYREGVRSEAQREFALFEQSLQRSTTIES